MTAAKRKMFKRGHDASFTRAMRETAIIRNALNAELEALAVASFGPPDPAKETFMAPPAKPVTVKCWHCGGKYLSDKMRLEYRPLMQSVAVDLLNESGVDLSPLWWCKNTDCDGAGFGHDLHEVAARKRA